MNPSRRPALAVLLLLTASAAGADTLCGRNAADLKERFIAGSPLALASREDQACKDLARLEQGRPDGDPDDAFAERWRSAISALEISDEESRAARPKYEGKKGSVSPQGSEARPNKNARIDRDGKLGSNARSIAGALGTMREDAGIVGQGSGEPSGPDPRSLINSNAQGPGAHIDNHEIPDVDTLHAMGSVEVAPDPGLGLRVQSLRAWGASDVVKQDVANVRALAGRLQLPPGSDMGLASSQAPLPEFQEWVKTANDSELPKIRYGILNEGEIGRYRFGMPIVINISIKDAEPEARAAVLFHELYHYWDEQIKKLPYTNENYGLNTPEQTHEHEYDPYYLTALMWQQTKPDGASSPLSKFLDGLPTDRDKVSAFVEDNVKKIKRK